MYRFSYTWVDGRPGPQIGIRQTYVNCFFFFGGGVAPLLYAVVPGTIAEALRRPSSVPGHQAAQCLGSRWLQSNFKLFCVTPEIARALACALLAATDVVLPIAGRILTHVLAARR